MYDGSKITSVLCTLIKEERIKQDMNIKELSKKSKISISTIRRIENLTVVPRLSTYLRLFDILGFTQNKKFIKKLMKKKIIH